MFKAMRFAPVMLMTTALLTTSACAASVYYPARGPVVDRDDRAYYDRGFREGRNAGADDARRGRRYDLQRHNEYRDNRRGDDRGDLIAFRRGFQAGYDEAYRMYARGGYDPRPGVPVPPAGRPVPRDDDRGRVSSAARENGYRDGLEAGAQASRSRERFDPVREKRYREGDHDYDRRFGSLDEYKREYRDAFKQGYDVGYRGRR